MSKAGKIARIYMRVSTDEQDLTRQERLVEEAKASGFYIAKVYREKASGALLERPELIQMIHDLQEHDVVISERMDRISRLPLPQAEELVGAIRAKGARLAVPGVVDLSELVNTAPSGVTRIVLEAMQDMLLKLALQMAHDDYTDRRRRQMEGIQEAKRQGRYKGKQPNRALHRRIRALLITLSAKEVADLCGCSISTVKRVKRDMAQEEGSHASS